MKNIKLTAAVLLIISSAALAACGGGRAADTSAAGSAAATESTAAFESTAATTPASAAGEEGAEMDLKLAINGEELAVTWEDNDSVKALFALAEDGPLTVPMSMYGGFEQVGDIGRRLPSSDAHTTTSPGDIVLYSGDSIVVFYGSNSWAYTRLGRITGKTAGELSELLGGGDVTLTLSVG